MQCKACDETNLALLLLFNQEPALPFPYERLDEDLQSEFLIYARDARGDELKRWRSGAVGSRGSLSRGSLSWGRPLPQTTPAGTSDYGPRTLTAIAPFAFLSTNVPPTNMVVQSIPVSTCRFLVVTKQTDGAIFVGGCEAHGGSA